MADGRREMAKAPINILHLLGTAQPEGSSIARIVAGIAARLDPGKYRVHAWFLGESGPLIEELQAAGATTRFINWQRGVRDPLGAYRFWRCLGKHRFAIVHQHFGARSIRLLTRLNSDTRLVVHLHGLISEHISTRKIPVAARGADALIAVSQAVARQIPSLKPIVVHAGVESSTEFSSKKKALRSTIIIGTACRLVPLKGLVVLIHAFASLHFEFPNLQLEIAGAGPQREDLEREIGCLSLTDCVRFLGWQRDVRPLFRGWDIFAMPSLDEGFPIAALEAMSEGLPIVATAVGGLPELVADGRTGYLVPCGDVASLAGRLRLLIIDAEGRQAMGAAGRQRTLDHFSVNRMVAEIAAIYDSLALSHDESKW